MIGLCYKIINVIFRLDLFNIDYLGSLDNSSQRFSGLGRIEVARNDFFELL